MDLLLFCGGLALLYAMIVWLAAALALYSIRKQNEYSGAYGAVWKAWEQEQVHRDAAESDLAWLRAKQKQSTDPLFRYERQWEERVVARRVQRRELAAIDNDSKETTPS
jgi:hypothetical protein